jgi:ComF family protein
MIMFEKINKMDADYLFPVPLSVEKLKSRGFNQSWEIAKRIQCKSHIQKLPYVLKRQHHQLTQAESSIEQRHSKIRGAFYVDKSMSALLHNKTVIMVDDVMTSGATLNEIGRILKDNGVLHVTNWVLLRTCKSP